MFFERMARIRGIVGAALLLGLAASLGCGPKNAPRSTGFGLGATNTGCLVRASDTFTRYLDGVAEEQETADAWDCAADSLRMFRDLTEGKRKDVYSPQELRAFLHHHFLEESGGKSLKIQDNLLAEAMELKAVVVGGAKTDVTRADLDALIGLFSRLKEQTLRIRTLMPLTMNSRLLLDEPAQGLLRDTARAIGALLSRSGTSYPFVRLDALLAELQAFQRTPSPVLGQLREHLGLIQSAKGMLMGTSSDRIFGDEWSKIATRAVDWYVLALRWRKLPGEMSWKEDADRYLLLDLAHQLLERVGEAASAHTDGAITSKELEVLFEQAFPQGWVRPGGLTASSTQLRQWVQRAMELKAILAGGTAERLSRDELNTLLGLLPVLDQVTKRMRPFLPLTPQWMRESVPFSDPLQMAERNDAALAALKDSAKIVGEVLQRAGGTYSFVQFRALLDAAQEYHGAEASPGLTQLRDKIALIRTVKSMIMGGLSDRVQGSEWRDLIMDLADAYALALRLGDLSRYSSWMSGDARNRFAVLIRALFDQVSRAVKRHPDGVITFNEWDDLLGRAFPEGLNVLENRRIPLVHIKQFMRPLILRWMAGEDTSGTGRSARGLTLSALSRILARFEHWNFGQRYLEAVFHEAALAQGTGAKDLKPAAFKPFTLGYFRSKGMLGLDAGALNDSIAVDAVNRMRKVIAEEHVLFLGDAHQMYFDGYPTIRALSMHNLSESNWMHELARTFIAGYAESGKRAVTNDDGSQSVTFDEFKRFVNDIRPIGEDLLYIDPNDPTLAEKRFREGQMFTYEGTGSTLLNVKQASHLLALMLSGKRLADSIHSEIIRAGCKTVGWDPFGYQLIEAKCYRKYLFGHLDHFWVNMPRLAEYYRTVDPQERAIFERTMEDGARKRGYSELPINSSDSEGFGMIGQYVEVVFSRYDADGSRKMDWDESQNAFPVFKNVLHEISCAQGHCLDTDGELNDLFTYMLAHGIPPSTWGYVHWRYLPIGRSIWADRGTLMRIFGMLGKPTAQ